MQRDTYLIKTVYCTNHGNLISTERPYSNADAAAQYFSFKSQQGKEKKETTVNRNKGHVVKVLLLLQSDEQLEDKKVVEEVDFRCLHHKDPVQVKL